MKKSRGSQNINWIEQYCVVPNGPNKSQRVKLTAAERATVLWVYDSPNGPRDDVPINDLALAANVALLHLVGIEAPLQQTFRPATIDVDVFTLWAACSPLLLKHLERRGERVFCRALGTTYPVAA